MSDFRAEMERWDEQDAERTKLATVKLAELLGEPSYHHPGDGRPAWQGEGWRALLGDDFVLFLDDAKAMPSDEALKALGYCFWIGMGISGHRRPPAERVVPHFEFLTL